MIRFQVLQAGLKPRILTTCLTTLRLIRSTFLGTLRDSTTLPWAPVFSPFVSLSSRCRLSTFTSISRRSARTEALGAGSEWRETTWGGRWADPRSLGSSPLRERLLLKSKIFSSCLWHTFLWKEMQQDCAPLQGKPMPWLSWSNTSILPKLVYNDGIPPKAIFKSEIWKFCEILNRQKLPYPEDPKYGLFACIWVCTLSERPTMLFAVWPWFLHAFPTAYFPDWFPINSVNFSGIAADLITVCHWLSLSVTVFSDNAQYFSLVVCLLYGSSRFVTVCHATC